ncbi:MAG: lipopolysaccharide biosynthesis protein [Mycobacterium sp.]|nr:lipopolysaccharide biosynthesis protein [Mycobacterium sp.]
MSDEDSAAKTELHRSFVLRVVAAAAGMVSTFLLTVIVVRTLDSKDTAAFFAVLAALSIGPLVGRLGLGPNVVRLIPSESDPGKKRAIAGAHLRSTIFLTLPTAPLIALAATAGLIGHGDFLPAVALTTVIIVIETVRLMLSDIFAAVGRVAASVATMHYIRSTMVLPVIGLVAITLESPSLVILLATYAVVAAIQLAVALFAARHNVAFRGSTGIAGVRDAITSGTKLFSLELSSFLMMSGTIWLANAAFHPTMATHYSAAATIAMQVTILESLAALAVTPPAARLWAAGKKDDVVRLLSNLATVNVTITTLTVIALAVIGDLALQFAYGPLMRDANILLVILAASGIFQAAFNVNISLLIIGGNVNEVSRTAVMVLAVTFPLTVAAAFLGGPVELAIVSSCGVAALSFCEWLTARKVFHRAPRAHRHVIRAVRELIADTTGTKPDVADNVAGSVGVQPQHRSEQRVDSEPVLDD